MKRYFIVIAIMFAMISLVSAVPYTSGSQATDTASAVLNPVKYLTDLALLYYVLIPGLLLGTAVGIGVIVVLQYLGIDIIGWSIEIGKFMFDNLFLLIRWTLATEANLISMVVIFLLLWIYIIYGLPKMM